MSEKKLVQKVLDYDSHVEQTMSPVTHSLTTCDELVLDKLKSLNLQYYDLFDKHITQNGNISDQKISDLFLGYFLNPLYEYAWNFNPELKERQKAANVTQFKSAEEHGRFLEDYFFEKGIQVGMVQNLTSFGHVCSVFASRIASKGKVRGNILGHDIDIDCVKLGEEISPDFQTYVLRKGKHIGKLSKFHMRYDPETRRIIITSNDDEARRHYKLRASRTNKDVVSKDSDELYNKLAFIGLYGRDGNEELADDDKHENLVLMHEGMHDLYPHLVSLEDFSCQGEFNYKYEQASHVIELVTAKDRNAYLRLAHFLGDANDEEDRDGLIGFLKFSSYYMADNRDIFENIDFRSWPSNVNSLFLQFDKLTIDQIRLIAAEFMVKHMPEVIAHLN